MRSKSQDVARDMIFAWKCGLKSGCYYTHSKEAVENFDLNSDDVLTCSIDDKNDCLACSA